MIFLSFSSNFLTFSCLYGWAFAAREGFRDEKETFLVDFEQKKWDGAAADLSETNSLDILNSGQVSREDAEIEESIRHELGASSEAAAKEAEALQSMRKEAARRRVLAAQAKQIGKKS